MAIKSSLYILIGKALKFRDIDNCNHIDNYYEQYIHLSSAAFCTANVR